MGAFNLGFGKEFIYSNIEKLREKYPERFGEVVDEEDRKAQVELK